MAVFDLDAITLVVGQPVQINLIDELAEAYRADESIQYQVYTGDEGDRDQVFFYDLLSIIQNEHILTIRALNRQEQQVTVDLFYDGDDDKWRIPVSDIQNPVRTETPEGTDRDRLRMQPLYFLGVNDEYVMSNVGDYFLPSESQTIALGTHSNLLASRVGVGVTFLRATSGTATNISNIRYGRYQFGAQLGQNPRSFFMTPGSGLEIRPQSLLAHIPDDADGKPSAGNVALEIHQGSQVASVETGRDATYPRLRIGTYPTPTPQNKLRYQVVVTLKNATTDAVVWGFFWTVLVCDQFGGVPQNELPAFVVPEGLPEGNEPPMRDEQIRTRQQVLMGPHPVDTLVARPFTETPPERPGTTTLRFVVGEVKQQGAEITVSLEDARKALQGRPEQLSGGLWDAEIPADYFLNWPDA